MGEWEQFISGWREQVAVMPRLLVASLAGGLIGWEREARNRPAGLRTHMLVAIAAATLMLLGDAIVFTYDQANNAQVDPVRAIQAIVAGISFIGAGTIFVSGRDRVRGLTTAASLLAATAVGIASGLGLYALALMTTALVLFVLRGVSWIERAVGHASTEEDEQDRRQDRREAEDQERTAAEQR